MNKSLSASQEDYLEAILGLESEGLGAGIQRIASHLEVAKPSVTAAVKRLSNMGLVKYARYGTVSLTPAGKNIAVKVAKRHALIKRFLVDVLGVVPKIAEKDACAIEHYVSAQTVTGLIKFLKI